MDAGAWLEVVRPRLVPPLFAAPAVSRLIAAARELPADLPMILEAPLSGPPGRIDLSLAVKTAAAARALAERPWGAVPRSLLRTWAAGEGGLAHVPALWLELDLDRRETALPEPVLCARLPPGAAPGWLLDTLFPALHGGALAPAQRAWVRRFLEALPPSAPLLYAFSLRARGGDAVRLEAFAAEPGGVATVLARMAPELLPEARSVLPLFAGVERLHLSLDLAERVLPRCGIEGSFPRSPGREPRWRTFFDRLVAAGLCTPERRDAALAWPGADTFWTAPERWPLRTADLRLRCLRGLSHVKAVCAPTGKTEAKVYLTLGSFARAGGGAASSRASPSARST